MPAAYPAVRTCFWFARSEDSNRATAPQRRNQQSSGLLVSPRESPRGMRRSAGPDGGSLTESVGLLFCCYSPGRRVGAPSGTRTARARRPLRRAKRLLRSLFRARESPRGMRQLAGFGGRCPQRIPLWGLVFGLHARRTRTAAEATAACGGNREPKQGQRSQRRRPAQGAPADAGTATRTVPAVRSGGQKGSCGAFLACGRVPRGMRQLAGFGGRCPQRIPLWGLAFGLHARRTRTAAEATAACGGNREPKQGQWPQRWRPAAGSCLRAHRRSGRTARTGSAAPRGGAAFRFSACRRAGRADRRRKSVFCWADCTRTRVENWKF